MPDYLTVREVAAYLRVSDQWVYARIKDRWLPASKMRGEYRISRTDLLAAMQKAQV